MKPSEVRAERAQQQASQSSRANRKPGQYINDPCAYSLVIWPEKHAQCIAAWCECKCHKKDLGADDYDYASLYGG